MSPSKRGKPDCAASPDADGDRISALPDDALHHVLSFLPAEDAVRTCVLARRWRHLWKSATGLRILFGQRYKKIQLPIVKFRKFVKRLLLLRKRGSPLHTCELKLRPRIYIGRSCLTGDKLGLNLWIRHIVDFKVRMFRLEIENIHFRFDQPLLSQHLTTLALVGVAMTNNLCNFSNCPNLEHLEFESSDFSLVQEISSKSLKHLSFNLCKFDKGLHTLICTPSLVSLRLDMHFCLLPVLDSMPSLKEAFLRNRKRYCCDQDCYTCKRRVDSVLIGYESKCILLQGLSEAENLTLMSDYNRVVFHRDLEWCPTFNNLRTLLLNEWWCLDPDFYGLNLILKHSPVLEKLNLHLFTEGPQHKMEMIGRYNQVERPATILKHLKEIEVKCDVVNEQVYNVLKFLGTFGITFLFK